MAEQTHNPKSKAIELASSFITSFNSSTSNFSVSSPQQRCGCGIIHGACAAPPRGGPEKAQRRPSYLIVCRAASSEAAG